MKNNCAIWSLGILMLVSASECHAPFGGCDDFNDNSIDASRWSSAVAPSGVGFLTETNQRLEFTTTNTPIAQAGCWLWWISNSGSYTQDWELKVDVNIGMPVFTNASLQQHVNLTLFVSAGMAVSKSSPGLNVDFVHETNGFVRSEVSSNGERTDLAIINTSATNLALRIVFDSSAKVLSAFFDENAANCGYSWQSLGSTVVPASWGMTTNSFYAMLAATAENVAVASTNNLFFDNFRGASGPIPRLQIARQGNAVAMSWPTNAPDFQLESTTTLSTPICWRVLTNAVMTGGTNFTVTDPISSQTKFFRLSRIYGCL